MSERAIVIELSDQEREELLRLSHSQCQEFRLVQRAKIILNAADGVYQSGGSTVNTAPPRAGPNRSCQFPSFTAFRY